MLVDYYYDGWVLFDSPMAKSYHDFLLSRLPDRPEIPLPELDVKDLTRESLEKMSNGYTFPVVVRGVLKDSPALKQWADQNWWVKNYGNESVLCKYVEQVADDGEPPECTVEKSFGKADGSGRLYISGESKLFGRRPELEQTLNNELINSVAPGDKVFTQIFMGFPHMGSDVHGAVGCNIFRQIVGRKKWWLFPQSQTPYVRASINKNGFSAHTLTKIGKEQNGQASSYLTKLERYTVILEPGDILLNPPWIWHGIKNLGEDPNSLVIGVPTRYKVPYMLPALRNNPLFTVIALRAITKRFGGLNAFVSNPANLQNGIELARNARAGEMSKGATVEELEKQLEDREKAEREM